MHYDDQQPPFHNQSGGVPPHRPPPSYAPPPPPPPRAGGTFLLSFFAAGCATILAPVLLIGAFTILMFYLISSSVGEATRSGGSFTTFMERSQSQSNLRTRIIRSGHPGAGTVAIVSVEGAIGGNGSPLHGDGALAFISEQLRAARENEDVRAVILQIDSPGGGLTASDLLHHEVELLKEEGKPVIAWAGSVMASGGYYIAVAADSIMASPTATVGSIGVIMQHFQVSEMLEKIGVKVNPVTSGERKDLGSPFRDMTPDEKLLLQEYVDRAHRRFVSIVAKGRDMPEQEVAALADGGIMDAEAAREKKLVDSVGYIEDAIAWAEEAAGERNMRVVGYRRHISLGDLFSEAGAGAASALVESAAGMDSAHRVMAVYE